MQVRSEDGARHKYMPLDPPKVADVGSIERRRVTVSKMGSVEEP